MKSKTPSKVVGISMAFFFSVAHRHSVMYPSFHMHLYLNSNYLSPKISQKTGGCKSDDSGFRLYNFHFYFIYIVIVKVGNFNDQQHTMLLIHQCQKLMIVLLF